MQTIFQSVKELKQALPAGKRFAMVGGAFDLIHVGHLHVLEFASSLEDLLVVAVLSDSSIRNYKGVSRPIIPQDQRARMVESLKCVDFVYILSDTSPSSIETLRLLRPDSVIFGEELAHTEQVSRWSERIRIHSPNTKIHLLPRYAAGEVSTSSIVNKLRKIAD